MAGNIVESLPSEKITQQLQQKKAERLGKKLGTSDVAPSELSSSTPSAVDEDGRSLSSFQSENYMHASQMGASSSGSGESSTPSSKAQLWDELKISCQCSVSARLYFVLINCSNYQIIHSAICSQFVESTDSGATQSTGSKELPLERCISGNAAATRF